MFGELFCRLVRRFGGKHKWRRITLHTGPNNQGPFQVRRCQRCGYVPPKRGYKREEAKA